MSFLEKNLQGITEIIQNSLFAQQTARLPGLLQRLDPRTKIICFILFLLAINLSKNILFMVAVYVFILFLAYFSKISLNFFITRVWLFLPFFTGIIVFPAIFNIFSPGKPLLTLVDLPRYHLFISVTQNGVFSALYLLIRVATSVSSAILLILTTDWIRLLKAFDRLHFPQTLIIISLMTYRYIFVLLKTTNNMFLARKSRMIGKPSGKDNRIYISSTIGTLFTKTQFLSEEIYKSMQSRGYRNRIYILSDFKLAMIDLSAFLITISALVIFFIIWK